MENLEESDISPVELTDTPPRRSWLTNHRARIAVVGAVALSTIGISAAVMQTSQETPTGISVGEEPETGLPEVPEPEPATCWSDDVGYGFEEWQVRFPGYECITEPDPCAGQPDTPECNGGRVRQPELLPPPPTSTVPPVGDPEPVDPPTENIPDTTTEPYCDGWGYDVSNDRCLPNPGLPEEEYVEDDYCVLHAETCTRVDAILACADAMRYERNQTDGILSEDAAARLIAGICAQFPHLITQALEE